MKNFKIVPKGGVERSNAECGLAGESERVVNVRERESSLESVGDWGLLCRLREGDNLMLIDHRKEGEFFLLANRNRVSVGGVRRQGVFTALNSEVCTLDGEVKWMQSVGEFVAIGTSVGLRCLRYEAEVYYFLDFADIAPQLVFSAVNVAELSERVPAMEFDEPYSSWERLGEVDRLVLTEAVNDACKSIYERAKQKGGYIQPVTVRYAVRLWDNSYAWISAPVVVGCGVQLGERVSASVSSSMTGMAESELRAKSYNIGVSVVKPLGDVWKRFEKSVDVLVGDEMKPYINGSVRCRCDYSLPERSVTYWFEAKESYVARAEIVNPAKWQVIARLEDMHSGSADRVLRSRMYNCGIGRDEVARITHNIGREVIANAGLCNSGRLYMAGNRHVIKDAWQSVQYWSADVTNEPCEVITVARLRSANGEAVKVDRKSYDFTPAKLNAMVAYSDARATELTVKVLSGGKVTEWSGTLMSCEEQGIAYAMSDDMQCVELSAGVSFYEPTEQNTDELRLNELTVSAVANPFVMSQCREVGQSEALALATVQKSLYSSTFGRYPVYVFAREGIFAVSYKEKGDYSDAQLVDIRTVNENRAVAVGDGRLYFVSQQGALCELIGKDVRELSRVPKAKKLAWIDSQKELLVVHDSGTVRVMMPSGRWIDRNEGVNNVYADYHDAIIQDLANNMSDANNESIAWKILCVETYPIMIGDDQISPVTMRVNVSGDFAEGSTLMLLGSEGENCEWRVLSKLLLEGKFCKEVKQRVYAPPCRLVKVAIEAEAKSKVMIRNVIITYNG